MRIQSDVYIKCPYGSIEDKLWVITIKPLIGLENYGAGDDGNIYRIKDGIPKKIKPSRGGYRQRYYQVKIGLGSNRKNYYIHRLVCRAFYGDCLPHLEEVRHLDGNSINNKAENLDWGTKKQNSIDRLAQGNITHRKLTPLEVDFIKSCEWRTNLSIPQCAKIYGVSKATIENIIYGKSWQNRPQGSPRNTYIWKDRITLEITDIRVERLQEISEMDALKEGCDCRDTGSLKMTGPINVYRTNMAKFKNLWNSLMAKKGYGWDKNCWTWVISFRKERD